MYISVDVNDFGQQASLWRMGISMKPAYFCPNHCPLFFPPLSIHFLKKGAPKSSGQCQSPEEIHFNQNLSLYINSCSNTSSLSSKSLNSNSNTKFHVDSKANSHFRVLYSNIWQCFSHSLSNKWSKIPKTWKFGPISILKIFNTHLSPFNRWDFCFQSTFQIEASQKIPLASVCKRSSVVITSRLTGILPLLPLNSPLPTNYLKTTRNP